MLCDMKTISIAVSESDYEVFRRAARQREQPIAQLIRDAMRRFRETELEPRSPLRETPVLAGHRPLGELPSRSELYDEMFAESSGSAGRQALVAEDEGEGW